MSYFMGIDLGTSSVKTVLTDEKGSVIREDSKEYRLMMPREGWKEIKSETWWAAVLQTVEAVTADIDKSRVKGIGVTGQMHSLVLLDEGGQEVRPVLMWNDTRTAELIPELQEVIRNTSVAYINSIISTGSPAANLYWVKKNEPMNFARIRHFLIGPDYIVYRLTGSIGTDFCEASTSSLYDLEQYCWSEEMLEITGISPEICPPVRGSAQIAGTMIPELAGELGLSTDVKVITGTGDNPAASIPTGCLGKGDPVLSLGTSAVFMFLREQADFKAKGKNILFSFDGKKMNTLVQGVVQSCGSGYSWLMNDLFESGDYSIADKEITHERRGNNKLLCYPHLVGDKTIYKDPSLRGMYVGIGTDTTRVDFIQAYMEGISYAVKQLIEELKIPDRMLESLKVIGGGSKSRTWMQILSDILEIPIEQMEGNAGAGYGMALLCGYACGEIESMDQIAEQSMTVKELFYPEEEKIEAYRTVYDRYRKMHDAFKLIFE